MKASAFLFILSVAVSNAQDDEVCAVNAACSVEGSSCTNGQTETCCGETHDSFRCDCSNGKYMCMYTDACMRPSCGDDPAIAGMESGGGMPILVDGGGMPLVDGGGMPVVVVEDSIACETGPAALPEKGCSDGEFCILASPTTELDIGVCNNKSGVHTGVCQAGGEMCTMDYTPVCGCDGTTHSNECVAHSMGVSVAAIGECIGVADVTFTPEVVIVDVVAEPVAKPEDATAPSTTAAVPEPADVAADVAAPANPAPADVAAPADPAPDDGAAPADPAPDDGAAPADPAPTGDAPTGDAPDPNVGATFSMPDCVEDCDKGGTFESSANGLGGVPMMVAASVVSSLVSIMLA